MFHKKQKISFVISFLSFLLGVIITSAIYSNILLFEKIRDNSELIKKENIIEQQNSNSDIITKTVPIVAVNQYNNKGIVGNLTIKLIPGNSNVLIDTNPFSETDLQYSANIAITVAKLLTNNYAPNKDFILSYNVPSVVIGGESAGAATAIAAIAALENRDINRNVVVTGTINQDGTIGQVGGILEKAKAVADAGYKLFLVPKGQTKIRYYEKVVEEEPFGFGFVLYNERYVPRVVDIKKEVKKEWGLEIIEVSTIEDVMKYMLE